MTYLASHAHTERVAKERGQVIVHPTAGELFIDIDSDSALEVFEHNFHSRFRAIEPTARVVRKTPSRTPGHWHIVVQTNRLLSETERLLLQVSLGSDPLTGLIGWERVQRDEENVTAFFEDP